MAEALQSSAAIRGERAVLVQALASRVSDPHFFSSVVSVLPNPDVVLRKTGLTDSVYDDLLADAHVWSVVQSRWAGVESLEWEWVAGGGESFDLVALELVQEAVHQEMVEAALSCLLEAPLRGRSILEVLWRRDAGRILPGELADRPLRRFPYGPDGDLRLVSRGGPFGGEPVPARKFLVAANRASYRNPYGEAALSRCFWPYKFKHGGWKWWVKAVEKYATDKVFAWLPPGSRDEEHDKVLQALLDLNQNGVGTGEGEGKVQVLSTDKVGTGDAHLALINACNAEISKAILSQTLSTEVGSKGSYAATKGHLEVRQDVVDRDAGIVERAMNTLARWVTELNQPGAAPPRFRFVEELALDEGKVKALGDVRRFVPVSLSWSYRFLGVPAPAPGEAILPMDGELGAAPKMETAELAEGEATPVAQRPADIEPLVERCVEAAAPWAERLGVELEAQLGAAESEEEAWEAIGRAYLATPATELRAVSELATATAWAAGASRDA